MNLLCKTSFQQQTLITVKNVIENIVFLTERTRYKFDDKRIMWHETNAIKRILRGFKCLFDSVDYSELINKLHSVDLIV